MDLIIITRLWLMILMEHGSDLMILKSDNLHALKQLITKIKMLNFSIQT